VMSVFRTGRTGQAGWPAFGPISIWLPHPSRFSKGGNFSKQGHGRSRPLSLEFLSAPPWLRDETTSKLLTQREGVHRYPQRGCSQHQYRLALLVHPAFKFAKRHVSWPRFFSSIHFTSEEKLTWQKCTGPWLVFCCS